MEIKKHRENFEVNVFDKNSHVYSNILIRDPNRIAQILMDLYFLGFPIEKALAIFKERLAKKDWLGF